MTKTELLETVWGHTFVTESTLTSRIKSARRAIGDDGATQRFIRTVHGRGYQFVGTVIDEADADQVDRTTHRQSDGRQQPVAAVTRRVLPVFATAAVRARS